MTFVLGPTSLGRLSGVGPDLVKVVKRAIEITPQDFSVFEGLRSRETQAEYLKRGVTRTMNSKHLRQPTGFGHAVDLVPFIDGRVRWEWGAIWPIAEAMKQAAQETGILLRWGGVWDRTLNELGDLKTEVDMYCKRHPGPDFLDGPHYELI